ncbi:alpha/beta hydrolase [Monashia sp. NPDC004114]
MRQTDPDESTSAMGASTQPAQTPPPTGMLNRMVRWARLTLPGCWGAVVFAAVSYTPSLLPRGGLLQGIVCGITGAIGYGLGVTVAWIWRAFADRQARPPQPRSWRVFLIAGGALLALAFGFGQYWQYEIRRIMGVDEYNIALVILSPLFAVVLFGLLLAAGRGIRALYHRVVHLLKRWIGPRAANFVGWALVASFVYLLVTGVLLDGLRNIADQTFSVRNGITEEGVTQPTTALRSGGAGSLVPWDTLGREGRTFAASGPSASQIQAVIHHAAKEPIRAYAGLESADDAEARARLAVDDLARAGGFDRADLLVITTTGSGWVDPALIDSFEYLSGDSAAVAMQYSYLPSWISYLVDQSKAREAGRALFDAVYEHWIGLPQDHRPRLYVAGESLGSFGGETAFSGEFDLRNRTAGTVFVGPPNFNTLFREFSDHRDSNSMEIQPVYKDGRTVRFASDASADIPPDGQPWEGNRVLYLMHASDPIVWWSPNLIFSEPDWTSEPPGKDTLDMIWIPFVTFWQVTADLPFSTGVPGGFGHKYTEEQVDAWNAVLKPQGITPDVLSAVRDAVAHDD